jgi:putative ABC transport system permease protein
MINPRILGVRLSVLLNLYGWRLRRRSVQELLAASGIVVGVSLIFGVLVANTSITASAGQLAHQLLGSARLALTARSSDGFDAHLAQRAAGLPGVEVAAPVLRQDIALVGPSGRESVQLVGVTPGLATLGGLSTEDFGPGGLQFTNGLVLPSSVAGAIGVTTGQPVTLLASGSAHKVVTGATLSSATVGAVASSPIAISLLGVAQRLTGRPNRVTEVFVRPRPGADRVVADELRTLAQGRLDVGPADHELRLLEQTATPNNQSTTLFASISGMVGFLLAINAMLLTVPIRRRFIADLRMQGFDSRQVVLILGFQAIALGLVASLIGVGLGDVLSRTLFQQIPDYLAFAFPLGTQRIVHSSTVLVALGCGVLATLLASLPPLLDLSPSRPVDAVFRESGDSGEAVGRAATLALGAIGAMLLGLVSALILISPTLTVVGGVILALATPCLIPPVFGTVVGVLARAGTRLRGSMLAVAVMELRATTMRSVALGGVAALAVYGSVAIGGARHDLVAGLDSNFSQYLSSADAWVTTGGNDLTTNSFRPGEAISKIAHARNVKSVRVYQGGLLDVGSRRMWIVGRPSSDSTIIPTSQLLDGDLQRADGLIRHGAWAAISDGFATERKLELGDPFILPTPSGQASLKVAAIITNVGWPPGAVIINSANYSRYWQTSDPSALEIDFKPGVSPATGRRSVIAALGSRPGLRVQTFAERRAQYAVDSRQGLQSLGEISTLLLITAALAVACALSTAIWQRRARLASLKIQGFDRWQLWRSLLIESTILLSIGCTIGALLGLWGHELASRWLRLTTGFPAPLSISGGEMLLAWGLVAGISLAVIALPGFAAARVPPRASFQE